jgi:hypothetical protein
MTSDWFPARHCGDKLITRAEIERATAEYLANGGTITRIETCIYTEDGYSPILDSEYDYETSPYFGQRRKHAPTFTVISDVIYFG